MYISYIKSWVLFYFTGKTSGLLGVWDDDNTNDFTTPNGTVIPPASSTEHIYYEFGLKCEIFYNLNLI